MSASNSETDIFYLFLFDLLKSQRGARYTADGGYTSFPFLFDL